MLGKLIPVLLVVIGAGGGVGAGLALRPAPPMVEAEEHDSAMPADTKGEEKPQGTEVLHEYAKLTNQFVVPIVKNGRVASLVALSLSLEVTPGLTERVFELEPKLRDGFLQVMFDHANAGGFDGSFTDGANLVLLRQALRETATRIFGKDATDVLIVDIVRQDS